MVIQAQKVDRGWEQGATITPTDTGSNNRVWAVNNGYALIQYNTGNYQVELIDLSDGSSAFQIQKEIRFDAKITDNYVVFVTNENGRTIYVYDFVGNLQWTDIPSPLDNVMSNTTLAVSGDFAWLFWENFDTDEEYINGYDLTGTGSVSASIGDNITDNPGAYNPPIDADGDKVIFGGQDPDPSSLSVYDQTGSLVSAVDTDSMDQHVGYRIDDTAGKIIVARGPGDSDNTPSVSVHDLSTGNEIYNRSEHETREIFLDRENGLTVAAGENEFSVFDTLTGEMKGELKSARGTIYGIVDRCIVTNGNSAIDELLVYAENGAILNNLEWLDDPTFIAVGYEKFVFFDSRNGVDEFKQFQRATTGEIKTIL